jgi:ABC-type branched-subunit amino acid transport system permease subunit
VATADAPLPLVVIALFLVAPPALHEILGLYLRAIYETERGAAAVGVNIFRYKMLGIGLSSATVARKGSSRRRSPRPPQWPVISCRY